MPFPASKPVTQAVCVLRLFRLRSMIMHAAPSSLSIPRCKKLVERIAWDDPETVKLTSIYYNLLRRWAQA
jgi:predicted 2-oxoglutarate/Fe(II)-dependent dioxygenase YbiX